MSGKYFNIDEQKQTEDIEMDRRYSKYSKRVLIGGLAGLAISIADYYISASFGTDSLSISFNKMGAGELAHTAFLALSGIGILGGGTVYGLSKFFEMDAKKEQENKANTLIGLNIEQKEKINALERNLRD
jgi:hypothetical protein